MTAPYTRQQCKRCQRRPASKGADYCGPCREFLDERQRRIDSCATMAWNFAIKAKRLRPYCQNVPLEDIAQTAMIGLIKAAEAFDPARGCLFSTCAGTYIKTEITREYRGKALVRVPVCALGGQTRYQRQVDSALGKI